MIDQGATQRCPACGRHVQETGPLFVDRVSGIRYHPMCLLGMPPAMERVRHGRR